MSSRINRILIPFIIITLLSTGDQTKSLGQTSGNSRYLPLISYNPSGWIGPYGGTIVAMAVDPTNAQIIYAGSFGAGIFKSTNGGLSWHSANQGLTNLYIYSLAIDPAYPSTLYAGTFHDQVYKSQDGGNSWSWSGSGIQAQAIVYAIAIDPVETSTLYAATRGASNNNNPPWNGVVYKSLDGGNTWTGSLLNVGGYEVRDWVYSLAINPNAHNEVFAASHENGPYWSDDSGATWNAIINGINDYSSRAIIICPQEIAPTTLYLGVWHNDSIYKSTNNGELWKRTYFAYPSIKVYSLAMDPYSATSVYLSSFSHGVLKTVDGGESWQSAGLQTDLLYNLVINPRKTNNLFVGTEGDGLYRSLDYAVSWQHSNEGINNAMVTSVIQAPAAPYTMTASIYGAGVYQSEDGGQTWDELNKGLGDKFVHALVANPAHPNILYALTDTGGLYLNNLSNTDGWVSAGQGLPLGSTRRPAFPTDHPFANLDTIESFAFPQDISSSIQLTSANLLDMEYALSDPQIAYLATNGSGVYRSVDGGSSWQSAGLEGQSVISLAIDPSDHDLVYAATEISGSLQLSTDGGSSWTPAYLPVHFYSLATSPIETGVVYAGTDHGMYRYQSGGWTLLGLPDQTVTATAVNPARSGVMYAGTTSGAYYTMNGGTSWDFVDNTLRYQTILAINFDRATSNVVYFSTKTHGTFLAIVDY